MQRAKETKKQLDPLGLEGGHDTQLQRQKAAISASTTAQQAQAQEIQKSVGGHVASKSNPQLGSQQAQAQEIQMIAQAGVSGPSALLPHHEAIQRSFGAHDVSNVRAHVGGDAKKATAEMGAEAYAVGDSVAFDSAPTLATAAHEAAHVVQQRKGVQLSDGVGRDGDVYEKQADKVADTVVKGGDAQPLLSEAKSTSAAASKVQLKGARRGPRNSNYRNNPRIGRGGVRYGRGGRGTRTQQQIRPPGGGKGGRRFGRNIPTRGGGSMDLTGVDSVTGLTGTTGALPGNVLQAFVSALFTIMQRYSQTPAQPKQLNFDIQRTFGATINISPKLVGRDDTYSKVEAGGQRLDGVRKFVHHSLIKATLNDRYDYHIAHLPGTQSEYGAVYIATNEQTCRSMAAGANLTVSRYPVGNLLFKQQMAVVKRQYQQPVTQFMKNTLQQKVLRWKRVLPAIIKKQQGNKPLTPPEDTDYRAFFDVVRELQVAPDGPLKTYLAGKVTEIHACLKKKGVSLKRPNG